MGYNLYIHNIVRKMKRFASKQMRIPGAERPKRSGGWADSSCSGMRRVAAFWLSLLFGIDGLSSQMLRLTKWKLVRRKDERLLWRIVKRSPWGRRALGGEQVQN
ncbi:hypothetical protein CAPTEDRAFT_194378 [Capitella teleta]|uniref:Uncharacterized protein n=1 Tax=Capitella teleta TaxID=283909 RepID=R7UYP1_CAPTE|nr:hypothetical protein CAPTEDRAFT_194378 [Capitella teleta]|eukprot:ELU11407.1 hypothetical protein CAPTEDRAFT_194378 [Capitella teleta]